MIHKNKNMTKKSALGFCLGLVLPISALYLEKVLVLDMVSSSKQPFIWILIATSINLLVARLLYNTKHQGYVKGIIVSTVLSLLIILFIQKNQLEQLLFIS